MKLLPLSHWNKYRNAVQWIENLSGLKRSAAYGSDAHPRKARARLERFMALLGNPHKGFKIVHVTGTSGKGSTAMMVGNILRSAGKRTGIYVSPHTTTTIERFHGPDGRLMKPALFVELVERLKPIVEHMDTLPEGTPSYLEMMVGLAFLFFKHERCEWVVLEVGMGGARDATNIISPPQVAAITPIDIDHAHLIGPSLANIAREKSGIIKRGTHVFSSERRPSLRRILEKHCQRVNAHWHDIPEELPPTVAPSMIGEHQRHNAALAWAIGRHLKLPVNALTHGIQVAQLPCRFETVQKKPMVILDGGHNALAIRALAKKLQAIPPQRLVLVVALAETKNAPLILHELPPARHLVFTRFISSRSSYSPGSLQRILKAEGLTRRYGSVATDLDADHAVDAVLAHTRRTDTVVITGSLYLTGELRKRWISEEKILKCRSSF